MLVSHFQTTGKYDRIDDVKCLPPPKHAMLVSHFQITGKYDRSHEVKCIPP